MDKIFSRCGNRCDLCLIYRPNVEKEDRRAEICATWDKLGSEKYDPEKIMCDGCLAEGDGRVCFSAGACKARPCVIERGLEHCGHCPDYPCAIFPAEPDAEDLYAEMKKRGVEWTAEDDAMMEPYNPKQFMDGFRLEKASEEAMCFLRGRYAMDEVDNGKDEVSFRDGDQTILTIYIRDGYYDFQVGESMVRVSDLESLEEAKRLVLAVKAPNRKPFPKELAVYARCGHRCDLCVHYSGGTISKACKRELQERVARVYGGENTGEWDSCPSCGEQAPGKPHPCMGGESCWQLKCAAEKGFERCQECNKYDDGECRPWVGYARGIEARSISAEDVTWAILPYVYNQYGN